MLDFEIFSEKIITDSNIFTGYIGIKDGVITTLTKDGMPGDHQRIDYSNKLIFPGIIDAHVHFKALGVGREDIQALSEAAAFGGVTTVIPFYRAPQGMGMAASIPILVKEMESSSIVDFSLHLGLHPIKDQLDDIYKASEEGVKSFKFRMDNGVKDILFDDYTLVEGFKRVADIGGVACIHAENGAILNYYEEKARQNQLGSWEDLIAARPPDLEAEAVSRAVILGNLVGCRIYIVHLSSAMALDAAITERLRGRHVILETCPQYLTLTDDAFFSMGALAKVYPILRKAKDIERLWDGIAKGWIEVIGSDNSAYKVEEKMKSPNAFDIPMGMPGVETILYTMYNQTLLRENFTLVKLTQLLCGNPAKIFGIYPRKGVISVGSDADLVIYDPAPEWILEEKDIHGYSDYSCYEGQKFRGKVLGTMIRGTWVFKDNQIQVVPGYGKFIRST